MHQHSIPIQITRSHSDINYQHFFERPFSKPRLRLQIQARASVKRTEPEAECNVEAMDSKRALDSDVWHVTFY